jgi:hypothetical protein
MAYTKPVTLAQNTARGMMGGCGQDGCNRGGCNTGGSY